MTGAQHRKGRLGGAKSDENSPPAISSVSIAAFARSPCESLPSDTRCITVSISEKVRTRHQKGTSPDNKGVRLCLGETTIRFNSPGEPMVVIHSGCAGPSRLIGLGETIHDYYHQAFPRCRGVGPMGQ